MEEPHVFECQLCYTCVHVCVLSCFSCVRLFATLWTLALQAPLSMRFSMQEYWSGLQSPPSEGLPHPEIQPVSLLSSDWQTIFFLTTKPPGEPISYTKIFKCTGLDTSLKI